MTTTQPPALSNHAQIRARFGEDRCVTDTLGPPGARYESTTIFGDREDDKDDTIVYFDTVTDHWDAKHLVLVAYYRHGGERIMFDVESMDAATTLGLLGVFVRQEGF
jgi:hypothetical protein